MILLGRALFFNETLPPHAIIFFTMALIGTYLVTTSHHQATEPGSRWKAIRGIAGALLAAFTETLIYFFVRSHPSRSPFFTLQHLYPSGLAVLLLYSFFNRSQVDVKRSTWLPLIAFNALLGFSGYILRFFSIPKLPTIIFSILSFVGVIAAYIWGIIFAGEKPNFGALSGGVLIATAIGFLRYFA